MNGINVQFPTYHKIIAGGLAFTMSAWPAKPLIYEINTCVWLNSLSRRYERQITLADVPDEVLDELAAFNTNTVWLMGIWQRSEAAQHSALNYTHEYREALPDLTDEDVIGSAYAIATYEVDALLGGREGLAALRERLRAHGLKLILDFVPNHVAVDHPWVTEHPEYMVTATKDNFKKHPGMFFKTTGDSGERLYVAHGRDPYFPGWILPRSTRFPPPIGRQPATFCWISPLSATAFAAIWQCLLSITFSPRHGAITSLILCRKLNSGKRSSRL
jgi:hypothetical protein